MPLTPPASSFKLSASSIKLIDPKKVTLFPSMGIMRGQRGLPDFKFQSGLTTHYVHHHQHQRATYLIPFCQPATASAENALTYPTSLVTNNAIVQRFFLLKITRATVLSFKLMFQAMPFMVHSFFLPQNLSAASRTVGHCLMANVLNGSSPSWPLSQERPFFTFASIDALTELYFFAINLFVAQRFPFIKIRATSNNDTLSNQAMSLSAHSFFFTNSIAALFIKPYPRVMAGVIGDRISGRFPDPVHLLPTPAANTLLTPASNPAILSAIAPQWAGGFGSPFNHGGKAMRHLVCGFFLAHISIIRTIRIVDFFMAGVMGGRMAYRFRDPVYQLVTSAARCLVASVGGNNCYHGG